MLPYNNSTIDFFYMPNVLCDVLLLSNFINEISRIGKNNSIIHFRLHLGNVINFTIEYLKILCEDYINIFNCNNEQLEIKYHNFLKYWKPFKLYMIKSNNIERFNLNNNSNKIIIEEFTDIVMEFKLDKYSSLKINPTISTLIGSSLIKPSFCDILKS